MYYLQSEQMCNALDYFLREKANNKPQDEINEHLINFYKLDIKEIESSVNYMRDIGYVNGILKGEVSISFIGLDFIKSDGFSGQKEMNDRRADSERVNGNRLVYYTLALAIGTFALVAWEMIKFFYFERCGH